MSLAVLARKTKTQQRLRSTKCSTNGGGRSVGFVLNMTGRGGGIGLSGMSYKQRGMNCRKTPANMGYQGKVNTGCQCEGCCSGGGRCKTGQAGTCCAGDGWPQRVSQECRSNCGLCWYGGLSQPAPQMSYRTYINRKANAAYRPGGSVCCDKKSNCADPKSNKCLKPKVTWKQSPDILASEITEHRAQATIRCANNIRKRKPRYLGNTLISNKLVAKPVCSWYNPETCQYETVKGPNPLTQNCQCTTTLPIKGRLGYTRINKNWCNTTKTLTVGTSSSEQIAKRKQRAFLCPCGPKQDTCTPECDGEKNIVELGVNYGNEGYSITKGPTKLCRCDTTFVLTRTPYAAAQRPQFISVINPSQFLPAWDDNIVETFYNNTPLAINLGTALQVKFKIPAAWCEAGYKKLYFFEVSNPPIETGAPSWDICAPNCDNEKKESARYCYPRPFHTGKNCGLSLGLTRLQKEACKQGCPKYWYSGNLRLR